MTSEEEEYDRAIEEMGLQDKLRRLSSDDAERLYSEVERRFSDKAGATWIWEHLRMPAVSRVFGDDRAFERLALIVPSDSEELLFFPGSDESVACVYRGTIGTIAAVIAACYGFEYCVAPLEMDWLVCENHHGVLYAVGEPVGSRLRAIAG
jgi:hypothetical protein